MISQKAKDTIDSLSAQELRFEIERGKRSRFQRDNFAYLKVRLAELESGQEYTNPMTEFEEAIEELDDIVGCWQQCAICNTVYDSRNRVGDYKCPKCKATAATGNMYFEASIHIVVSLIHEAIMSRHSVSIPGTKNELISNAHCTSVLLFFCTLREACMNHFLKAVYFANNTSLPVFDKLMSDNRMYSQKQDQLVRTLTGCKWTVALAELSEKSTNDYTALNKQMKELGRIRNEFTHEGWPYEVDDTLAENCVLSVAPLTRLYVDLHNRFVYAKGKGIRPPRKRKSMVK